MSQNKKQNRLSSTRIKQVSRTVRHGLRHVGRRIHRIYDANHVESETHEEAGAQAIVQFQQFCATQQSQQLRGVFSNDVFQ